LKNIAMKTISTLIALFFATLTYGETTGKPSIFVAPLDGDVSQIVGWQTALGEGLAEMLITKLSELNKFEVLESTALPELVKEIQLGEAGYVGESEAVKKGGFAGADFMFRGKVTRFGAKQKGLNLGGFVPYSGGNLGLKQTTADVQIDWRIVDVYTRKILKTGAAVAKQTGGGFDIGVAVTGHGGNIGFNNSEFMNSALGRATVKAVSNIVSDVAFVNLPESGRRKAQASGQLQQANQAAAAQAAVHGTPGKVLAVPAKGVVVVSLGSKQGFKSGDKVALYQTNDIKDDKGNVVFSEEKLVGEVTLDAVQEDRSKANYTGDADVKAGWVVKAK
jgi:curli biogenesis system outer membrane secretion channel CsgG